MQPSAIGHFQIQRGLGRGGIGVVYLETDSKLDRQVAIKALPADLADDPDRLARFQREAKVLASLNHSNIGGIHGLEVADGQHYLVLEYIEGEMLADRLERRPCRRCRARLSNPLSGKSAASAQTSSVWLTHRTVLAFQLTNPKTESRLSPCPSRCEPIPSQVR